MLVTLSHVACVRFWLCTTLCSIHSWESVCISNCVLEKIQCVQSVILKICGKVGNCCALGTLSILNTVYNAESCYNYESTTVMDSCPIESQQLSYGERPFHNIDS